MKDGRFWKLINEIDRAALKRGEPRLAVIPLKAALAKLSRAGLEGFHEQLTQKLYSLDGPAFFARANVESSMSGDGFLYARCFVVAQGKKSYEAVLSNPKLMPTSIDDWCEALLSVAWQTYEQKTGKIWRFESSVSWESFSNAALWSRQ